jgi:hypothetical protein
LCHCPTPAGTTKADRANQLHKFHGNTLPVSELEFQSELHLQRSRGSIRACNFSSRLAKCAGIGGEILRLVELHAIEEVVDLGPELHAHSFVSQLLIPGPMEAV